MSALPEIEAGDQLTADPADLTRPFRYVDAVYMWQGIPLPVSGDAITRGRADWDHD